MFCAGYLGTVNFTAPGRGPLTCARKTLPGLSLAHPEHLDVCMLDINKACIDAPGRKGYVPMHKQAGFK